MSSPNVNITAALVGSVSSPAGVGNASQSLNVQSLLQLLPGTGGGQADTVYEATTTIAASGSSTIALTGGGLLDPFGNAIALLHVKAIVVIANAGNTNDVLVGPGATNPFNGPFAGTTPTIAVSPGETLVITKGSGSAAGWPVVASTAMNLKLANSSSGSGVTFQIFIIGTST